MKNYILLPLLAVAIHMHGQKKELKQAEKLFIANDIDGAAAILEGNAALFEAAKPKEKARNIKK